MNVCHNSVLERYPHLVGFDVEGISVLVEGDFTYFEVILLNEQPIATNLDRTIRGSFDRVSTCHIFRAEYL